MARQSALRKQADNKVSSKSEQPRAKRSKKRGSYLPAPEQQRIQQQFIAGNSLRKIARDTGHHQGTIARIVKAENMQQYLAQMRERFLGLGEDAVKRVQTAIHCEKEGPWLAYELLKDIGVVPDRAAQLQEARVPVSEEDEIRKMAIAFVDDGMRRLKFFGKPFKLDEDESLLDE